MLILLFTKHGSGIMNLSLRVIFIFLMCHLKIYTAQNISVNYVEFFVIIECVTLML